MPKKLYENTSTYPHRKEMILDEQQPHTLAEFIEESMRHGIFPEELPSGMSAAEAGKRFGEMHQVMLKPLIPAEHYFHHGWFPEQGKPVTTATGDVLFTIFTGFMGGGIGHRLRLEPAAIALLSR